MKKNKKKHNFVKGFSYILSDDKWSKITIPILAVLLTIFVTLIIILILGKNPGTALSSFLKASGFAAKENYAGGRSMLTDFFSFLGLMAPMLLAALGFIVAFKAGLFNIGIAGQMLLSGFLASIIVGYSGLNAIVAKPLVLLVGMLAGGLLASIIGILKYRFNINEVISSIMLNYIVKYITGFYIKTKYINMITRSSRPISPASRLTITNIQFGDINLSIPLGIIVALIAVFAVRFLLDRTVIGFEIKTTGLNRKNARYAGINTGKSIVLAMMISGVLSGLAGVTFYLGYYDTIVPQTLAGMGFDSIAVSILGNSSPIGAIFASALVTLFQNGSTYVGSTAGVAREIANLITGFILLFSACGVFFKRHAKELHDKYEYQEKLEKALNESVMEVNE